MASQPSTNGANGRSSDGRFTNGNAGGPGNPLAKRVALLRSAMLTKVTERDLHEIVAALVKKAKKGDIAAAREVLDRTLGKSKVSAEVELEDVDNPPCVGRLIYDLCELGVPKQYWPPGVLRHYGAWQRGLLNPPPDLTELVKRVEARNCTCRTT